MINEYEILDWAIKRGESVCCHLAPNIKYIKNKLTYLFIELVDIINGKDVLDEHQKGN